MDKLFEAFKKVLEIHIKTKTYDSQFHEKTKEFYELLFDVFHQISEKEVDISEKSDVSDEVYNEVYDLIEDVKNMIEDKVAEKNSIWMDNLLRWFVDKLEFACWDARAFVREEMEEEELENKLEKILWKSIENEEEINKSEEDLDINSENND